MIIYEITDTEFMRYGKVLTGYDFSDLFEVLEKEIEIPEDGFDYVASVKAMESLPVAHELSIRCFGGMPIQLGAVFGKNDTLNCLEYHKSSELNIAQNEVILMLGKQEDLVNNQLDTSNVKAFRVPTGTGVELYATTLHYAPCNLEPAGYRVVCALPRGTNGPKPEGLTAEGEDCLCMGINKWLLAHADAPEIKNGAFRGLVGTNIKLA